MLNFNGYKLDGLPLLGLEKVSDIIEFEGPILSHFRDENLKSFLFYWIDNDEISNRWLIWHVKLDQIIWYLRGQITLVDILPQNNEFVYVVDIDRNLVFHNPTLSYVSLLPEQYLPPASYFTFEIPHIYQDEVESLEYEQVLKDNGLYFNVDPSNIRFGHTVGLKDAWNVFMNIGKSFSEYVYYNVSQILSQRITDKKRIELSARELSDWNRMRIVSLAFNSVHVGLSADSLHLSPHSLDPSIMAFHHDVMKKFQDEVLDNDFSDNQDIDILIGKYPDAVRKNIFDPLIAIINNDNIRLNITNNSKKFNRTYKRVNKFEKAKLLPSTKIAQPQTEAPEKVLVYGYFVAEKKEKEGSLFPRDAKSFLYTQETNHFNVVIDSVQTQSAEIVSLSYPIQIEGTYENGYFVINFPPLMISEISDDYQKVLEAFHKAFNSAYQQYLESEATYPYFKEILG